MENDKSKIKKVVIFSENLYGVGGAERLLFEEAKYFEKLGIETYIFSLNFKSDVLFNNTYDINVEQIGQNSDGSRNLLFKIGQRIFNINALRQRLKEIKPDIIISTSQWDCITLYLATIFTTSAYVTHIHGTIFWFHDDPVKYALIYRNVFNEIRDSVIGHKEFIPVRPQKASLSISIFKEFYAVVLYLGVRKAKKIFVLSNQMKWEVNKLYGKDAIVLKGAFPKEILDYKPRINIKEKLGISDKKIILNVNRLDTRKRISLLIKAFKQISDNLDNVVLIIGGVGPEEGSLKALATELDLQDRVKFVGYIKEEELWDYITSCDVFVHPNWADFAIAAYEPLALQKKIVWSTEMEIDEYLAGNKHIFTFDPATNNLARVIERALNTEVEEDNDLSMYTWDKYFEKIYGTIIEMIDCK